jgi:hypothetical protein
MGPEFGAAPWAERGDVALSPRNFTTEDESACTGSKCLTPASTPSTAAIEIDPPPHGATPKQQLLMYVWIREERLRRDPRRLFHHRYLLQGCNAFRVAVPE